MTQLNRNRINSNLPEDQQSIVAHCTPQGSGAIAVVRISGVNAVNIVEKFSRLSCKKTLSQLATHTINHGFVINTSSKDQTVIDEVLYLLMLAPKTFTGQDIVEISCHNNPFIIENIISLAVACGARLARRGEFTKRAFLNGKMDLVQAEAVNELIHAQSEQALRKSLSQLQGTLSGFVAQLEAEIIELLSLTEASFEFLDEEQRDIDFDSKIKTKISTILQELRDASENFNLQQQIRQGIRIAIVGAVNAGKSTLFNALVGKERAIVTPVAGTTRDSIEFSLYKNGCFWLLIDTAGLRQAGDFIEQQGIQRSWDEAAVADIVLVIFDASQAMSTEQQVFYQQLIEKFNDKIILVANKIDALCPDFTIDTIAKTFEIINISAKQKLGVDLVEKAIFDKIQKLFEQLKSPFLLNQRQYQQLSEIQQKLDFIESQSADKIQYELVAYQLKEILENLSSLTGRNVTEQMLDKVFDEFCVGK